MQKPAACSNPENLYWLKSKLFLSVVLCMFCLSCAIGSTSRENPYAKTKMKEIEHPNGLIILIPEVANNNQTANGFSIIPPPSRGMSEMSIDLNRNQSSLARSEIKEKTIDGRFIKYQIEKNEGEGSSGDSYAITAEEKIENGRLIYHQRDLSKLSEPSFDFFWLIVEQTDARSIKN